MSLPIDLPQKIICVGLNYRDHAEEPGTELPKEPDDLIATGTPAGIGVFREPRCC